ncbi:MULTISPECIES: hypothetical protein [unclassified Rhodococcus (in: high G+C Gram-positive bacteria)]|uniref:hypothetical protein n=1 Tax=unclassified Rhodococcus (in: high G+C Gram-positive bacteria) TaxID=192944 RepID=UPI0024B6BB46|nr:MULTISPECIES: hypothetical protein [unclassified Rhodococcus (in: high G+C Gram-positive bacteria)]MDI9960703.1 hypothetical protein [Rhodococcus sp. IEGM 1237]MDI9966669.1 hypothetical protein [Rhodococcus sp. IEGM 1251]MDV8129153.1 hypothetical protein [Rhodococcus sp. IEGM 1304]
MSKSELLRWSLRTLAIITVAGLSGFTVDRIINATWNTDSWDFNQWGNVGTWVAGIGTFAAVVVAVLQTQRANLQARAAEKRADDMQDALEKSRIRVEEIDAVSEICRAADLFINSVRRYYDVTGALSMAPENHDTLLTVISVQADMADRVSEAFRTINLAAISLETELLIEEYLAMTSALQAIKDDVALLPPSDASSLQIKDLINESSATISMAKDNFFHAARKTHATTNIYPILARMQKEADDLREKHERADAMAKPTNPTTPPRPESAASEESVGGPA